MLLVYLVVSVLICAGLQIYYKKQARAMARAVGIVLTGLLVAEVGHKPKLTRVSDSSSRASS
jgi:hypothetical protein